MVQVAIGIAVVVVVQVALDRDGDGVGLRVVPDKLQCGQQSNGRFGQTTRVQWKAPLLGQPPRHTSGWLVAQAEQGLSFASAGGFENSLEQLVSHHTSETWGKEVLTIVQADGGDGDAEGDGIHGFWMCAASTIDDGLWISGPLLYE